MTNVYYTLISEFENEAVASMKREIGDDIEDNETHFDINNIETSEVPEFKEEEATKSNLLAQNFQEIRHGHETQIKLENTKKLVKYRTIVSYML